MADARSLLRVHRAANRIEHPHAAYSDAGKLLCKICHEVIKSESLWEGHIRGAPHRQKVTALKSCLTPAAAPENGHKRKLNDVDESMSGVNAEETTEEAVRKKRSKTDMVNSATASTSTNGNGNGIERTTTPPIAPGTLTQRTSGTPGQGVEISIPSRPATPLLVGEASGTSTPKPLSLSRSPLVASGSDHSTPGTAGSAGFVGQGQHVPTSTESLAVPQTQSAADVISAPAASGTVDKSEWAAFEAEIAAADAPAAKQDRYAEATISAPAMTAEQLAAKSQEEENERKKHLLDAEIADEREDAARAMEDEFDEMEQLESRVKKLKERREELRKGGMANLMGQTSADGNIKAPAASGKENSAAANDDEDSEDDDEDWDDGFRFRA